MSSALPIDSPFYSSSESLNSWNASDEYLTLRPPSTARKSRSTRLRDGVSSVKRKIFNQIDPKAVWQLIDCREVFWPFTWKKYSVLFAVCALVAGIVFSNLYFHWINKAMQITRRNMLPVLVIVIGLEPIMITVILVVARIPKLQLEETAASAETSHPDCEKGLRVSEKVVDHRTALVIPCYKSDEEALKKVLESAYLHFRPQDIFIVDNGRGMHPASNEFRQFIQLQSPDIRYIWSPIPSKNAAQLVGALAAHEYDFIMTVDDDVSIPASFSPPTHMIDRRTKGVAFPLKAIDAEGKQPLFLVAWQDCEYRMSGLTKLAESSLCGVLHPHGAGWFCERLTMIDLISNYHSIDFIAEDVNTGISMMRMKKLIKFDSSVVLETEVPTTVFGPGLNWWKQRYKSWEMGRHGRLLAFCGRFCLSLNGQTTPWGILVQKFILLYSIATIIVDWVRIPVYVTMGPSPHYWLQGGLLCLVASFPILAYKYIKCRHRPDLQPRFWAAVTYPVYKQLYALVSIFGAIRAVLYYIGGHPRPKTIRQMIKEKDERAFWLDSRFRTNPGFLAE